MQMNNRVIMTKLTHNLIYYDEFSIPFYFHLYLLNYIDSKPEMTTCK